jgi:ribonuclease R
MERKRKEKDTSRGGRSESNKASGARAGVEVTKIKLLKIFTGNPGKAFGYKQISRRLDVTDKAGRDLINDFLKQLRKEGKISPLGDGNFILNTEEEKYIEGTVDLANNRHAYVITADAEEDIRIATENLKFAMGGDRVRVRLMPGRGDRQEGEVVEIIERVSDEVAGRIEISKNFAFLVPNFKKLYFDVFINEDDINGAQNGDKVLVKITEWPKSANKSPIGKVTRVFGPAGENEAEINSIMAEFGLPFEFPEGVEQEAEAIPETITETEIASRRDFRNITTFTIDPLDAKDFDDALSIKSLENGRWEIGVHIADVTHYIEEKSKLEKEAIHRATSVYLVDRTIPMLPEKLSNGLCSLRPHEDKLTFSAVFEMDESGRLYDTWIGKTIIHSDRRFAYEEAQQIMDAGEGDFVQELLTLDGIAKKLKEKRFKNGAISFETTEVRFKLDENGKPLSVFVKERKDVHKLIEEFMLLANRKVAEYVFNLKKRGKRYTMVYRTHDTPDQAKLSNFSVFAAKFGYKVNLDSKAISAELNKLTEDIEGKPEQSVLQNLAIRTMAKAKYTTEPLGHFGLAFEHYSHFTSPIRRYPDMMAHRLIFSYLNGAASADKDEYEEKCKHSSEQEKRAADAERASIKYKQVEFMLNTVGQKFKGIVSGLTEWGMFVEIEENKCEGMIRLADLEDDFYELDSQNYRIIGRKNKRMISFGDEVWVEVKAANLNDRTIDLILIDKAKEGGESKVASSIEEKQSQNNKARRGKNLQPYTETKVSSKRNAKREMFSELEIDEVINSPNKDYNTQISHGNNLNKNSKSQEKGRNLKDYYGFDE